MLWDQYVFRRKSEVYDLWDSLFTNRSIKLLYITGCGFDFRAQLVLEQYVRSCRQGDYSIEKATLLLIDFQHYELDADLTELTNKNFEALKNIFHDFGAIKTVKFGSDDEDGGEKITANHSLRLGTQRVLDHLNGYTDVILDVSSLPRVMYLSILTGILTKLVPDKKNENPLASSKVNFQVLVAEDAALDSKILSEDPNDELVSIPGFSGGLNMESMQNWPLVWFPILGETRSGQLNKIANLASIHSDAEICPVLPHPSKNPRRSDNLRIEYRAQLFDKHLVPPANVLLVHESNPFEAYRQLFNAMKRYKTSLSILDGCRLYVSPLSSKLMTIAAGLACFNMRPMDSGQSRYDVSIPYAEPRRYVASSDDLKSSEYELASLLLTGIAYADD